MRDEAAMRKVADMRVDADPGSMRGSRHVQCHCKAELVVVNDDDVVCVGCGTLSPRWVDPESHQLTPARPRFTVDVLREAYRNTVGWVDPA